MKKLIIISILLILSSFLFSSCSWEKDIEVNGIKYSKMQYLLDGKDTTGIYGRLAKETIINGYPCTADWIEINMENKLMDFCLSEDFRVKNVNLKKGTWVFIGNSEKMICVFPKNTEIQGYQCQGGGGKKGIHTSFYPSGKLWSFYPVKNIEINGISCKSTLLNYVELYENGNLKYCKLAKEQEIRGELYKKNEVLRFDKDSKIVSVE